jgi:uroporphyrin-III C-methyltransferase/precorrin-2 dehydrogenase/sirohydrochlorin ferrochelatase
MKRTMDFFPIFINLKGRACLVVGGGDTAFRKASALLRSGALVRVVSPDLCEAFKALSEIEYTPERFQAHTWTA